MSQTALSACVLSVFLCIASAPAGEVWWSDAVTASLERAGARRGGWEAALRHVPEAHRTGLAFLLEYMPDGDLASLDPAFVLENVALAYAAREATPWGKEVPEAVFLNDVLPYANISERRDPWRAEFMTRFLPLVQDCTTPAEAAHRLNQRVFPELGVKYSTERNRADQSPQESIDIGVASCTGLSIVLADACRAVGVPARLAGIPNWTNKRGNHTWVEIWNDGRWHFAGAAEPDPNGLDHAWFVGDAKKAQRDVAEHAIYALSYRATGLDFPMVFDPTADPVPAVNVTDRYADPGSADDETTTRLMVRVVGEDGKRVAARVTVRNPDDATATFSGVSRDESVDLNDLLTFDVTRNVSYEVEIRDGGTVARAMVAADAPERVVDVTVGRERVNVQSSRSRGRAATALAGWFADPDTTFPPALDMLVARHPERARTMAWNAYRAGDHAALRTDFDADRVRYRTHESPYVSRPVGKRPAGGWPLVIAMHGGGGTTQEVNDQQWRHMQIYYRDQPDAGGYLYVALRAPPNNTWNGFYDDYVYPLVTNLIRQHLLFADVDANRVYLIGYSHGGYGAFSIGPKIPHRFAAIHASAAAPTDGDSVPRGLRTTPFTYMIGEDDNAYGRRERCLKFDEAVRGLKGERTDIYPVVLEYQEGYGHRGLPDRDKLRELLPYVRNPHPRELSWEMTDTVVKDHFWVSVPEAARGRVIEATCEGNRITLDVTDVPSLTLHLDERLVDPSKPIEVVIDDETLTCQPVPSMRELCASLAERGDPQLSSTMRVDVDVASKAVAGSHP